MASYGSQQPFSNDEKNYLLAELVKAGGPPHQLFLNFYNSLGQSPRLDDIPLPPGRSLNACRAAWEEMRQATSYSPHPRQMIPSTPLSAPIPPLRRAAPGIETQFQTSANRPLLPRTSGFQSATSVAEPPLKRKRGRPTKAEQQARAEQQTGEPSNVAGARFQTPLATSMPTSPIVDTRPRASLPPGPRVPISAIVSTPTGPPPTKSASHSGSSSGRRRRRRRSDEQAEQGNQPPTPSLQYNAPEDTPARSTGRRREDPILSSVAGLRVSEPEQSGGAPAISPPFGGIS